MVCYVILSMNVVTARSTLTFEVALTISLLLFDFVTLYFVSIGERCFQNGSGFFHSAEGAFHLEGGGHRMVFLFALPVLMYLLAWLLAVENLDRFSENCKITKDKYKESPIPDQNETQQPILPVRSISSNQGLHKRQCRYKYIASVRNERNSLFSE